MYSSYAMLKLQVSASWMMSRRAAAMRRARARVESEGRSASLESGGVRRVDGDRVWVWVASDAVG
jgi:hypothetical protein